MATVILLTSEQANTVRGPSAEFPSMAALQPIALTDGRFILGVEVLTDPMHSEYRTLLASLPTADFSEVAALLPAPAH